MKSAAYTPPTLILKVPKLSAAQGRYGRAVNPSAEAYFERQMDECREACDEFERAALLLVKHGATREALHEQLDEVIDRGW